MPASSHETWQADNRPPGAPTWSDSWWTWGQGRNWQLEDVRAADGHIFLCFEVSEPLRFEARRTPQEPVRIWVRVDGWTWLPSAGRRADSREEDSRRHTAGRSRSRDSRRSDSRSLSFDA